MAHNRLDKLILMDAPNVIISNELKLIKQRTDQLREIRQKGWH
jgi:hypothetical protein